MSRRLILGCGYLGQALALQWREKGLAADVTTRTGARADALRALGLSVQLCDVLDPASVAALPGYDLTVWCVGRDRHRSFESVAVEGLANFLAHAGRGRFVYCSSTSVYGQSSGEWVTEDSATAPTDESGLVVARAEALLRHERPEATILRLAGLYGPGRIIGERTLRDGKAVTSDPDGWLNLIHRDDAAQALDAACVVNHEGLIVNVADDEPTRRVDYYGLVARLLGLPPPRFTPEPATERSRRIANQRMKQRLGVVLRYPHAAGALSALVNA